MRIRCPKQLDHGEKPRTINIVKMMYYCFDSIALFTVHDATHENNSKMVTTPRVLAWTTCSFLLPVAYGVGLLWDGLVAIPLIDSDFQIAHDRLILRFGVRFLGYWLGFAMIPLCCALLVIYLNHGQELGFIDACIELLTRTRLIDNQDLGIAVRLCCGVIGFSASVPLFPHTPGDGLAGVGILMGWISYVWLSIPMILNLALVHSLERALLERNDRLEQAMAAAAAAAIPLCLLSPKPPCCPICQIDIMVNELVYGYRINRDDDAHAHAHAPTIENIGDCKFYHRTCLLKWWRTDPTKMHRCPESNTRKKNWHLVLITG